MAKRVNPTASIPASKTLKAKTQSYEETDLAPTTREFSRELSIRNIPDLVKALKECKDGRIDISANVFFYDGKTGSARRRRLNRESFIKTFEGNKKRTFREDIDGWDYGSGGVGPLVGREEVPLLGGPFNKQLYIYDYLRQHTQAFYAYNHDPVAHQAIHIIRDFVLGRGWRVDCDDPAALALWRAFEEANGLQELVEQFVIEMSIYGEQFTWWLPNGETKIAYQVRPGQAPPKGIIPRVRLVDPSCIWEIVTYPEDITRVLYYQWVAPTQYQIYTGSDGGNPVPGLKFIYQQIPSEQMGHYKVNSVSNEKRGRSDLFPVLGYLKRLRDSVNYSIIGLQKATAWSVDTIVKGNQSDIDAYIASQEAIGTIPPAGSEFVHSEKIERTYMSNEGAARGANSSAFDWAFSMVCAGLGIPVSYFGTHLSGGQTRASAVVATEPVAKKFESRRQVVEKFLNDCAKRLFSEFGIEATIEITFPEMIVQDRTAKLKDTAMAEQEGWISKKRAALIAAKELGIDKYDYDEEQADIAKEKASGVMPGPMADPLSAPPARPMDKPSGGLSSAARKDVKDRDGN